jgi:hypothetical protein
LICVLYLWIIILLVGCDVPVDSETLLVTDFVNLKIKLAQSFGCAHRGRMCVHMFIRVSTHMCISIYICTVFLKKECISLRGRSRWFLLASITELFYGFVALVPCILRLAGVDVKKPHLLCICTTDFYAYAKALLLMGLSYTDIWYSRFLLICHSLVLK